MQSSLWQEQSEWQTRFNLSDSCAGRSRGFVWNALGMAVGSGWMMLRIDARDRRFKASKSSLYGEREQVTWVAAALVLLGAAHQAQVQVHGGRGDRRAAHTTDSNRHTHPGNSY